MPTKKKNRKKSGTSKYRLKSEQHVRVLDTLLCFSSIYNVKSFYLPSIFFHDDIVLGLFISDRTRNWVS